MNADVLLTRILMPGLIRDDMVIKNNLSTHKGPAVRAAIENLSARLLFLPPYSLNINPVKQALAKLKAHLGRQPSAPSMASGTPSAT